MFSVIIKISLCSGETSNAINWAHRLYLFYLLILDRHFPKTNSITEECKTVSLEPSMLNLKAVNPGGWNRARLRNLSEWLILCSHALAACCPMVQAWEVCTMIANEALPLCHTDQNSYLKPVYYATEISQCQSLFWLVEAVSCLFCG